MRIRSLVCAAIIAVSLVAAPPAARADVPEVDAYRALAHREPRAFEVVKVALKTFRLHPEALDGLRADAHWRALLPILAGGYRMDDQRLLRGESVTLTNPTQTDETSNSVTNGVSAGAVWDLRDLAFNPAQVQIYGLVGVQQDVMLEVVRTFYLRRQLQLRLLLKPPADLLARATMDLRVDEFTSVLDALTGGWFSTRLAGKKAGE